MNQLSNIPEDRVQRVTAHLRRQGTEVTPDEVRENLVQVAKKVRAELTRLGWKGVPEDDVGILNLMAELQNPENEELTIANYFPDDSVDHWLNGEIWDGRQWKKAE